MKPDTGGEATGKHSPGLPGWLGAARVERSAEEPGKPSWLAKANTQRTRSEVPEYVSPGEGRPKGTGEVARNDEQSSVLQTNPGTDWRAEPAPARLGELLFHWVPHECLL